MVLINLAAWVLTVFSAFCLFLACFRPRLPVRATFIVAVTIAGVLHAMAIGGARTLSPTALVTWASVASCFWSAVAAFERRSRAAAISPQVQWADAAGAAALWLGVIAGIGTSFLLVLRIVPSLAEAVWCVPWIPMERYGFSSFGLWAYAFLVASEVIALASVRDRRLAICLFWTVVAATAWYFFLDPILLPDRIGGFRRSPATLHVTLACSALAFFGSLVTVLADRWCSPLMARPDRSRGVHAGISQGMSTSIGMLAVGLILPIWFHFLVPIAGAEGVVRSSTGWATISALLMSAGCFVLLMHRWAGLLADALLGSVTQAICGAAVVLVSVGVPSLNDRFPWVFTAVIWGLGLTAAWFTWLAVIWRQQLDHDRPWTTEGFLIPHLGRFTFLNIALALVVGAVMTFWPNNPAVSTSDDTLGRVTAGVGAHLFVLLAALFAARRWRRRTLRLISVVAIGSTAAFLAVRMWPFRSHIG